ncbi:ROK family protein [Streptomyces sp. NPDC058457]|uniref:ROK family transcriptional regulator n=1 Tax=Streptomyces sp. NPDC058457 TaxID=3346507 RepID=UPI00365F30DD
MTSTFAGSGETLPPFSRDEDHLARAGLRDLSELATLVATGRASSKSDLARLTGLSRTTVSKRLDVLVRRGLLSTRLGDSTGGRPAVELGIDPAAGVVAAVDVVAAHCRVGVLDLGVRLLADAYVDFTPDDGPEPVMAGILTCLEDLLTGLGRRWSDMRAICIGIPGQVDAETAQPIRPVMLPGWEGVKPQETFSGVCEAPVLVDNDANLMALGEYRARAEPVDQMVFVKVGSGLGCGIISNGTVHRGADGISGELAHVRLRGTDYEDLLCGGCGNSGCLGAVVNGPAIAARLRADGLRAETKWDAIRLAQQGEPHALRAVREAGERIGEVLAAMVCFHNPELIVIGGAFAILQDDLLAGIRSVVYERALAQATRRIRIETTTRNADLGMLGAGCLAVERALSPAGLVTWL